MAKAISVAKELNNMQALAHALWDAGWLAHFERDTAEVELLASDLFELSTRQKFAPFLRRAAVLRGWARSASGEKAEGVLWIEDGIGDYRATGSILDMPFLTALRAEALYLADHTSDALEAIAEGEELIERFENCYWCALWVAETLRRKGIGRQLLARAEEFAVQNDCRHIHLDTFDFQARGFYEKNGFNVFGTIEDYPIGQKRYYLIKKL
jgi:GNAT superfamily N-acetyltransferase